MPVRRFQLVVKGRFLLYCRNRLFNIGVKAFTFIDQMSSFLLYHRELPANNTARSRSQFQTPVRATESFLTWLITWMLCWRSGFQDCVSYSNVPPLLLWLFLSNVQMADHVYALIREWFLELYKLLERSPINTLAIPMECMNE